MTSDSELLRRYSEDESEDAFAELVKRHLDLVYSAAIRQVNGEAPLAQEVTQSVFTDLARKATSLRSRETLSGWLYTSTYFAAAKAVRTETRRRAREQEAQSMADISHDASTETKWEELEPVLDHAMHQLKEADREAILLRFFEKHPLAEVGARLGISENAARMRIDRALDKLREDLSRRGVAGASAALALTLSSQAIQAAPIGLGAIVTGAALSGTTITTAATVTTKIIAMTTLQKVLITTALVVAAGTGIYEASRASRLLEQNQTLQQQQAPLAAQLQQLQRERDEATNRLSAVNTEVAQLKSGQRQNELLKLRGEVGTLRRQVFAEAKSNATSSSLEKMLADPDPVTKELINQQAWREIKLRFAELFQELKLSPEQIETFAQTYANPSMRNATDAEVESRLRSLLGDAGYARFEEFNQEVPTRATMKLLKSQLGANQLTEEQASRLWKIVKAEPYDLTYGIEGDMPQVLRGSKDEVSHHLQQVAESNQHVVQQAGTFLTPDQLAALQTVFANALKTRTAQAAALGQKP
ncbi:MAG: polymerase, sigma-24 subunit, subfamily [Verrucomicrobiales bacterium]|nr:polymerase, sigma-24 subunit, subfamily [Verrucomicrobiales bacterium]